jgi:hypothetical protein
LLLRSAAQRIDPSRGQKPLNAHPHIIDFEPKKRHLYQAATETGEVLTAAHEEVRSDKSMTNTSTTETGLKLGAEVPLCDAAKATSEGTQKWGNTAQDSSLISSDASRERRETTGTMASPRRRTGRRPSVGKRPERIPGRLRSHAHHRADLTAPFLGTSGIGYIKAYPRIHAKLTSSARMPWRRPETGRTFLDTDHFKGRIKRMLDKTVLELETTSLPADIRERLGHGTTLENLLGMTLPQFANKGAVSLEEAIELRRALLRIPPSERDRQAAAR